MLVLLFLRLLLSSTSTSVYALPQVRHYDLIVGTTWQAPDGFWREIYSINGQSPGPLIRGTEGDTFEVNVINHTPIEITIHWHGIAHREPWWDGAPGVTQWPILPYGNFTYRWTACQYGQYWYHSHMKGAYSDGIRGPLLIDPRPGSCLPFAGISEDIQQQKVLAEQFHNPEILQFYDWRHETMASALARWATTGGDPFCVDNILINGKGRVECLDQQTLAAEALFMNFVLVGKPDAKGCVSNGFANFPGYGPRSMNPVTCIETTSDLYVVDVHEKREGGWIVLNLINEGGNNDLVFSIDAHRVWIFAVDGEFVVPTETKVVQMGIGSRYQVAVKLDQEAKDYIIRVASGALIQILEGHGILRYGNLDPAIATRTIEVVGKSAEVLPGVTVPVAIGTNTVSTDSAYRGEYTAAAVIGNITRQIILPSPPEQTALPLPSYDLKTRWSTYNGSTINGASPQNDALLKPFIPNPPPGGPADITFLFAINSTDAVSWQIGNSSFYAMNFNRRPTLFNDSSESSGNVYGPIKNGSVVDILFQEVSPAYFNLNPPHPIHKHQSKVWVLGRSSAPLGGMLQYSSVAEILAREPGLLNLIDPPRRDVWNVPAMGWTVVRYVASTPGHTMLHCHIQAHLSAGMALVLEEGMEVFDRSLIPAIITDAAHGQLADMEREPTSPMIGIDTEWGLGYS